MPRGSDVVLGSSWRYARSAALSPKLVGLEWPWLTVPSPWSVRGEAEGPRGERNVSRCPGRVEILLRRNGEKGNQQQGYPSEPSRAHPYLRQKDL